MWHTEDTGLGNPKDNPLTKLVKSKNLHETGSPVSPLIIWSKGKTVQWNISRNLKKSNVANIHSEPVPCSYFHHLE